MTASEAPNIEVKSASRGRDPLERMRSYQLAAELREAAWDDAERLQKHRVTEKVAAQLYYAVVSISANISEGYSRSSRDRSRIFEYALGSARESLDWYRAGAPVLGQDLIDRREGTLAEILRLLLATIPRERDRLIRPADRAR